MTKLSKKIFSLLLIFIFAFALVACGEVSENEKNARNKANADVEDTLSKLTWSNTDRVSSNVVISPSVASITAYENDNNAKAGLIHNATAVFESSNPALFNVKWCEIKKRVEVKEGDVVTGLAYEQAYELRALVNRPTLAQGDTDITLHITVSIDYSFVNDNGQTVSKTMTKSKDVLFRILAADSPQLKTIGEIEALCMADYAKFTADGGILDENNAKTIFEFEGYVSQYLYGVTPGSFIVTDENGDSIYVYNSGDSSAKLYDKVRIAGSPMNYYDSIQIAAGASVTVIEDSNTSLSVPFQPITIDSWYAENDIKVDHSVPGTLVEVTGILLLDGTTFKIKSVDSDKIFQIYGSSFGTYEKSLINAKVGSKVTLKGAIYDFHSSGYWRFILNCYEFPIVELVMTAEEKFAADKGTIPATINVNANGTVTLPSGTLPNGSLLGAWTASVDGVIDLTTGAVINTPSDIVVELTATLQLGSLTETVKIVVTVKASAPKISVTEFLAKPVSTENFYQLTGQITRFANGGSANDLLYGNFYLSDGTSEVYVYGLNATYQADLKADKTFGTLNLGVGDYVTLIATRGEYGTTIETIGAYHVASGKAKSIAEFKALGLTDTNYYGVSGVVTSIASTQYGNLTIKLGEDELYIYGLAPEKGVPSKDLFAALNIQVGDTIGVIGQYGEYKSAPQMVNGYLAYHSAPQTDDVLLQQDIETLTDKITVKEGETLTLPAGPLPNGSVIGEWTASIPALFDENLVAAEVDEDTVVIFKALVSLGEFEEEVEIEVTIKNVVPIVGNYEVFKIYDMEDSTGSGDWTGYAPSLYPGRSEVNLHWANVSTPTNAQAGGGAYVSAVCPARTNNPTGYAAFEITSTTTINKFDFDATWWAAGDVSIADTYVVKIAVQIKDAQGNWVDVQVYSNSDFGTTVKQFTVSGFSTNAIRFYMEASAPNQSANRNCRMMLDNIKLSTLV